MSPLLQPTRKHVAGSIILGLLILAVAGVVHYRNTHPAREPAERTLGEASPGNLSHVFKTSSPHSILVGIRKLESASDPKCHATACRFENFVFGTPLTDAARDEKVSLQKALIGDIWARASRAARQEGEDHVPLNQLQPLLDKALRSEVEDNGDIRVLLRDGNAVTVSKVRLRQYSSIAYSLRAILGTQQDFLSNGGKFLLTLGDESVDGLRRMSDIITLAALKLADRVARDRNEPQITPQIMAHAWRRVAAEDAAAGTGGDVTPEADIQRHPTSGGESLQVVRAIIDEKLTAYRVYNGITPNDLEALFLTNIHRFYALYPVPRDVKGSDQFLESYHTILAEFTSELLQRAQAQARQSGHHLIRSADAITAVQNITPHQVDEFEDVIFFTNLVRANQITLEAYDCDSLRDAGIHWLALRNALDKTSRDPMALDPFAAEIITEGTSQYGVLLLRVAGRLAKQQGTSPALQNSDLRRSQAQLRVLATRHHNKGDQEQVVSRIASAGSATNQAGASRKTFFTDVTADSGINFNHRSSLWLSEFRRRQAASPPTFSGGGVAAEDINNDSYPDLLLVGGIGNALLINDGQGHFQDVSASAGIQVTRSDGTMGEARQPVIADFDNDGWQDLLITYANDDHRLYRNLDGRNFQDVSADCGLGGKGLIGGPATVFDFDGDGLLDIYICYFGDYLNGATPTQERHNSNALPNRLFHNRGNLRFEDVSDGSGASDTGWAQAVSHTDFDRDGHQDLIVANDFGRNVFLRNLGNGRFQDLANALGVTKAYHSMNVGIADLNADGYPDVYVSNFIEMVKDNKYVVPDRYTALKFDPAAMATMAIKEANMLYLSRASGGRLIAYEPSQHVERGATSTGWAWDAEFFDFDHDGDDDLYVVNGTNEYAFYGGMISSTSHQGNTRFEMHDYNRESNVFFLNDAGKLKNVSLRSGADFVGNSRSTTYLDLENDGDLDVVVNNFHDAVNVLRNNLEGPDKHWIKLRLIGDPRQHTNRDAIGARIVVRDDAGLLVRREVQGGSGFLSMNPKQIHLGVGASKSVDIQIVWPNGQTQQVLSLPVDQAHTIQQEHNPSTALR